MKPYIILHAILMVGAGISSCTFQPKAEWVMTTADAPWEKQELLSAAPADAASKADVVIATDARRQQVDGFGACFNELGWLSLSKLEPAVREEVMQELFFPGLGANFTICRMPVGANDFSRDWYSYDETEGDFGMAHFTVANDLQTLIPFIRNAKKYQPDLRLWASPWSPPSWMKYNKHYASAYTGENVAEKYRNGLPPDRVGYEGTDMFIQDSLYLQAYALYFSRFISAYREQGIDIFAVMPQNEFNSAQIFPSCCWTAASLARFIGKYLGPAMEKEKVDILFGTMERKDEALVDTVLQDPDCSRYVKGVGFQWAGKAAIPGIHARYPDMKLYQTEQECGNGKNSWTGAVYSWNLMRHYLENGASAYMYWNISLDKGGISRWGWAQNSLVVVDPDSHTFQYTHEYYVMKHVSHYVQPGAWRLETKGGYANQLSFLNPDQSVVVVLANESPDDLSIAVQVDGRLYRPLVKAHSLATLLIE